MRGAFRLAFPLLCLLLASCWSGPLFYTASETVAPITPGKYRSFEFGAEDGDASAGKAKSSKGQVRILANGLTSFESPEKDEKPDLMGFARLDGERWYVGWLLPGDRAESDEVAYLLLEKEGESYRLFMPNCDKNGEAAVAAGAVADHDPKVRQCHFPDRNSLEKAMRSVIGKLSAGVRLERMAR